MGFNGLCLVDAPVHNHPLRPFCEGPMSEIVLSIAFLFMAVVVIGGTIVSVVFS
jgi:hypothetical protein